jgi:hypothetical protein
MLVRVSGRMLDFLLFFNVRMQVRVVVGCWYSYMFWNLLSEAHTEGQVGRCYFFYFIVYFICLFTYLLSEAHTERQAGGVVGGAGGVEGERTLEICMCFCMCYGLSAHYAWFMYTCAHTHTHTHVSGRVYTRACVCLLGCMSVRTKLKIKP